ncbi:MAG TPA: hypothetical protein VH208_06915, partial [Myxococcaceae bacterium]|nr:hypothetical protein [Myxococcaceae bacterium]
MDCLSEEKLADLASGQLAGDELTRARFHISECPRCRIIAAELVRVTPRSGESVTQSSPMHVPLPERGTTFGRYVVLEPLGTGGMGVVCAAYDPQLDRRIALKLLRQNVHEASWLYSDRLLREAQLLARLSHPNVVAVHDVGTLGD